MAVYAKAARGEDEPSALAGLGLIEDGESLTQALQAKSWLAGSLAGLGGALDMADLARDPFGKLLSWGLAWVIEHFSPLKDWLNDLTGNPGEVRAFSQTWSSIGGSLNENSAVLARAVNEDMDGAEGVTIAAYRSHQTDMSRHIGMVGGLSEGMATSLLGVSVAVQVVHDLVRDRISDTVSSLAKYTVMEFLSLGALTPFIIEDVASQVLHSATVLRGHIKDLFHSGHALGQLADGAKNVLTKFKNALANHSGAGVRKAAGKAEHAAPALVNALGRGKSFNPPPPKPLVPGGSVERRALYKGGAKGNKACADFHLDADGVVRRIEKWHTPENVASSRIGGSSDKAERSLYRRVHPESVSPLHDSVTGKKYSYQAGHQVDAYEIPPARDRILDGDNYDVESVFKGEHKDAVPHVEEMRGMIADPSNPAHDWQSSYNQLSEEGQTAVKRLEERETSLNLMGQRQDINGGDFYRKFEEPLRRNVPDGSWAHSTIVKEPSPYGRPDSLTTQADLIREGTVESFLDKQSFPNLPPNGPTPTG